MRADRLLLRGRSLRPLPLLGATVRVRRRVGSFIRTAARTVFRSFMLVLRWGFEKIQPVYETSMSLDDFLIVAMRAARQQHLSYLIRSFTEHRGHETFRLQDWPRTREMGFICGCSGMDHEWRVGITNIRDCLPEARATFMRMRKQALIPVQKKKAKAERKAKALLYQFLNRDQKRELHTRKFFTVLGADGRTYQVTWHNVNNVKLLVEGQPRFSLCLVPVKEVLSVADIMLAQKIWLEADPDTFLRTAHVQDLETKRIFPNGCFLAEGRDPPPLCDEVSDVPEPLDTEVLDSPREWLEAQLRNA